MFTIDHFHNPEPLSIYLSTPSGELVECIDEQIDENSSSLTLGINQQYELNFTVCRNSGENTVWYDHLQEGMYLFVEKVGLFKMKQPEVSMDGTKESKTIIAYSCDAELEDKNCHISINMGTKVSQEYLVKYDADEAEVLVNPYTNTPYDWIVLYNTFPEQLQEVLKKYTDGYYGSANADGDILITDIRMIAEIKEMLSTIPRLKNRLSPFTDENGLTDYKLTEYVIYEYDDAGENVVSVTLTPLFCGRIRELTAYYTKYRNQLSLLSLVLENAGGNWSVGDIYGVKNGDYTLANKKYQFETDGNIYSFLTQTLAQTINCIVYFNLFSRKVSIIPAEYIGKPTGIVMSYETLMNSMDISCSEDTLCTRLFVTGADELGIEQVNFGLPYIDNITYKLNARDSSGRRIYVSDELAEKYMEYISFRESRRASYIQSSKDYNSYADQIYELKYRVPGDCLKTDWGTYTVEELQESLTAYRNLLAALITLYKEDYGTVGLDKNGNINDKFIRSTMYWYDYQTYRTVIKEIECAIATFPCYSKPEKWTSENLAAYKDAISAWKTDWSLYGSIELQAKIAAYTQNMKLLAESSVVRISPGSDIIKTWEQLGIDEKISFGNQESGYYYDEYMENYRSRESAQTYLDELLQKISDLEELQAAVHDSRLKTASEVAVENYFTEDECRTINLLYRDSSYNNNNILTTSLDNTVSSVDVMYELLRDGEEQLSLLSRPQLTFRISSDNLLGLPEFENLWQDFRPGNYMLVQYRDDTYVKLRMTGYTFNPRLPSSGDFTITFSNYVRSKTKVSDLESLLGLSSASSSGSGSSKGSGSSGGTYGESDGIDVTISNTMLSKLLNSETFGTRVTNAILDTLDVNALTARSAQFGGLADGSTTVNGKCITTGYIKDIHYDGTGGIDNKIGSILNLETGHFNFGGGRLTWNGKTLAVEGEIKATSGCIGGDTGFDIVSDCIRNGNISNAANTSVAGVYVGTDGFNVSGGSPDTTSYFTKSSVNIGDKLKWDGKTLSVNGTVTTGNLTATGGKVANFRISNGFLCNDIPIGTTGSCGISCGTALGGSDDRIFWAGDGIFRVDKNGALYATDASISGKVTATSLTATNSGTIACWNINSSSIYRNNAAYGASNGMYFGTQGLSIGSDFQINSSGTLSCTGANIDGKIRASTFTCDTDEFTCSVSDGFLIVNKDDSVSTSYAIRGKNGSMTLFENGIDFYSGPQFNGNMCSFWINDGAFYFDKSIDIGSNSIRAGDGNATIVDCSSSGGKFYYGAASTYASESSLSALRGKTVRIYSHNGGAVYLGSSGSTAVTSDENLKDISDIDARYEKFFMNLEPVLYKYKNGGHRKHIGYGARQVEKALTDAGISTEEFAGILIDKDVAIGKDEMNTEEDIYFDELYSLRYEEFGALYAFMLQKAFKRIQTIEKIIEEMKG